MHRLLLHPHEHLLGFVVRDKDVFKDMLVFGRDAYQNETFGSPQPTAATLTGAMMDMVVAPNSGTDM